MNGRKKKSTLISWLNYERLLKVWAGFIILLGTINFFYFYKVTQIISENEPAQKALSDSPKVKTLLMNYPNFALLFLAIGALSYVIGNSMITHILGEQNALLWQIKQIKNKEFTQKRNLRKNDLLFDTMEALHELSDQFAQEKK